MQETNCKGIIGKWLTGWSVSRALPPPSPYRSGFKVEAGFERQKCRYVFPLLNEDFFELAETVVEPCTYLKVCAPPEDFTNRLPPRWVVQPQGYLMHCFRPMTHKALSLRQEFNMEVEQNGVTYRLTIMDKETVAACGRVVLLDDIAIYDRISTAPGYRRRGLASHLLFELEKIALANRVRKNVLVATEEGKGLYTSLGWDVCSLYTTIVIPTSTPSNQPRCITTNAAGPGVRVDRS